MPYTFYAISCYILMRGIQVLFEEYKDKLWYKILIKTITVGMLIVALVAIINMYGEHNFLFIHEK
jgi:hypothetical protein